MVHCEHTWAYADGNGWGIKPNFLLLVVLVVLGVQNCVSAHMVLQLYCGGKRSLNGANLNFSKCM
jgi:hypothetical protein